MHAAKVLVMVFIGGVLLAGALFTMVPSSRPAIVKKWFHQAAGFTPATSAEDALDKLNKALEKRDYEAAKLYITGDYLEWINKGAKNAGEIVAAVDELKAAMQTTGVKSDKVSIILYKLDPFPPFKVKSVNKTSGGALATISWEEKNLEFAGAQKFEGEFKINLGMMHSLLPTNVLNVMQVVVKEQDGGWKVELPVQGNRHMRDTIKVLDDNATNYRNALRDIKQSIKNNPAVKEDFEREFKSNIEKAN